MSDSINNNANPIMTEDQITAVREAMAVIDDNMRFLIRLTAKERDSLPEITPSDRVFAENAVNSVINNPTIFPLFMDVVNMQSNLTLFTQLEEFRLMADRLAERITDTQMLAGSEAYAAAQKAYKSIGNTLSYGMPGANPLYDQLTTRFTPAGPQQSQ